VIRVVLAVAALLATVPASALTGREIIDGFEGAAAIRRPGLRLIHAQLDDTGEHVHDDGLIIFRKLPNEG
jgi:hypothetical protein